MVPCAQFTRHRSEDAGTDRLHLGVDQHRRVAIKPDDGAVGSTDVLADPHHHGLHHIALLHAPARNGFFHRHHDDVTDRRVFALRAAQHLDAHDAPRAGIVCHVQVCLHLYHGRLSMLSVSVPREAPATLISPDIHLAPASRMLALTALTSTARFRAARPTASAWRSARAPRSSPRRRSRMRSPRRERSISWTGAPFS